MAIRAFTSQRGSRVTVFHAPIVSVPYAKENPFLFSGLISLFAVGTAIADRPPHISGRAQLRHPAPTKGNWRQAAYRYGSSHAFQHL